jgi:Tol biopolymer transport system component
MKTAIALLAALWAGVGDAAVPEVARVPVFAQVTAPHSYYWREMYVPQLTAGPSGVAWSRDGESLYFSMQGRIWRQRIDRAEAVQITDGPGDDYQPDLSPNGRFLAFARRNGDAVDLRMRDLKSGREEIVAQNNALNLDPRWSPDGRRIAYVTTEGSGNFHIAIAERSDGAWTSRRWRAERKTEAPRYYYAPTDHELSPAWSPDGAEILFVSNADILHGTGAIFRQRLDLSGPARRVRDEETNWKARPDWSPDGTRIAYGSYLGRQWHQIWMTTAEPGGYPTPFTYGEFDLVSPRWSPKGDRLAAISNEDGALSIVILDVVGGARRTLETKALKRKQEFGALLLSIRSPDGDPVPARVQIRGADGRAYAPDGAFIHADDHRDRAIGFETRYFHSDGEDVIALPAGAAEVRIWRGLSARPAAATVEIAPRRQTAASIVLEGLDPDGAFANWKSADVHVHMNYGGAYRMTRERLAAQADAEALDLVFNLIVNKEQRIPDIGEFSPVAIRPAAAASIIAQAQEFHTSVWGHLGLLGLVDHVLIPDYAGYPKTAFSSLHPDNKTVSDLARRQGALVGYVHPFDPPAPDPGADARLTHALPADVALGGVDYLELVGFSDHRTTEEVWRRLLNCGFRLPVAGGTDAMTNFASLRGPLGVDRTYVDLGQDAPSGPQEFMRAFLDGLRSGRSFATNSALLSLNVQGKGPGSEIRLKKGARLKIEVGMASIAAIDSLDILINGEIGARIPLAGDRRRASASVEIAVDRSSWIALRAAGAQPSPDVFDLYPYAVTSPVYVVVDGKPQRSPPDAEYFIAWIDRLIEFARSAAAFNSKEEQARIIGRFESARREFERRR